MYNNKKTSIYILWTIIFFIESFIFKLLNEVNCDYLIWIILILNIIFVGCGLLKNKNDEYYKINLMILFSFFVRNVFLGLDILGYTRIFTGKDTETFYLAATGSINFPNNYVKFLKALIIMCKSRIALEYFNVICSLISMIILKKIFMIFNSKIERKTVFLFALFAFSPVNILLSSCLLRESIMIMLNLLSLYFYLLWYKRGSKMNLFIACFIVLLSSWFHSGMLVTIIGYMIGFILYDRKNNRISLNKHSFTYFIIGILLIYFMFYLFGDTITVYFNRVTKLEDIAVKRDLGNTDYLLFLNNTTSLPLIILSTPLKIIYFFFSPMPWDCFNISLVLVFLFSSTIYILLFYNLLKNKKNNKTLIFILMLVLLALSITYSWGTSNAGTAMRHREKILPFLIVLNYIRNSKYGDKNEKI